MDNIEYFWNSFEMKKILLAIFIFTSVLSGAVQSADWRQDILSKDRCLSLYRVATKERLNFCYWNPNKGYIKSEYAKGAHALRDAEYKKTGYIDVKLLDTLVLIQTWLRLEGRPSDIHILSGFRTPEHNAKLEGAAKKSEHMNGKAADIYIPGISTKLLAAMSRVIGVGGVGIYPYKNFVHVDTGRVRVWVYK